MDAALDANVTEALVDAVDAAQEGALAASRRPDHRGDHALANAQIDVVERLKGPVPQVQSLAVDRVLGRRLRERSGLVGIHLASCPW
jgi:hypothetical protein